MTPRDRASVSKGIACVAWSLRSLASSPLRQNVKSRVGASARGRTKVSRASADVSLVIRWTPLGGGR